MGQSGASRYILTESDSKWQTGGIAGKTRFGVLFRSLVVRNI
jgi:hypothetical protein